MKGGFTFCGVDIADIGLEYAPDLDQTYVYRPTETNVHEQSFDGHDGGYLYGVTKKPKEFVLRCFFEEKAIDRGLMTKIYHTFKVGNSGKLIFKRKPWCYYYATVTSSPAPELYNYLNGLYTVTLKAYYPFGRCDTFTNTVMDNYHDEVMLNTALFDKAGMEPTMSFSNITNSNAQPILLANPGTERSPVCISVAGNIGEGIVIRNVTTNQTCELTGFTKSETTDVNKTILVDSMNGKTIIAVRNPTSGNLSSAQYAFKYHDKGFIDLAPNFPAIRNLFVEYNGNTVTVKNKLYEDVVGKYIFVNSQWVLIAAQDGHNLRVNASLPSGTEKTTIMSLNLIMIEGASFNLSHLGFTYKPTFS